VIILLAMAQLNSKSTAFDALRGADLTGKTALVTGGNSGIGLETGMFKSFAKLHLGIAMHFCLGLVLILVHLALQ
jgi:hypothetical protein